MNTKLVLALVASGCSSLDMGGVESQDQRAAVIDTYERHFEWTTPPCSVYLDTRVLDEAAHVVQYTATVDGEDLAVVYSIDPGASHPLQAVVFDATGKRKLSTRSDEHELLVEDAIGAIVLRVADYDATTTGQPMTEGAAVDGVAARALACVLPARTDIGTVPRFLLNLATGGRLEDDPAISQSSSDAPPLLDWDGELNVLSSYVKQGLCLGQAGWSCPCFDLSNDTVDVNGWCQ